MRPTWETDPAAWRRLPLDEQLERLRFEFCAGPCGQSSSVLARREALFNALTESIAAYRALRDNMSQAASGEGGRE